LAAYKYKLDITDEPDKENLKKQADEIFKALDLSSMKDFTQALNENKEIFKYLNREEFSFEMSPDELAAIHELGDPFLYHAGKNQRVRFSGEVLSIFKLNETGKKAKNVIFPKEGKGETKTIHGRALNKDEILEFDTSAADGGTTKREIKIGDAFKQGSFVIGEHEYIIRIQPDDTSDANKTPYEQSKFTKAYAQNSKNNWDMHSVLGAISIGALVQSVIIGTPLLMSYTGLSFMHSLGVSTGFGATVSKLFMPCTMNAADLRGYAAANLDKQGITIHDNHVMENIAKMDIGNKVSNYHLFFDWNDTLTEGSKFKDICHISGNNKTQIHEKKYEDIVAPIIALGEQGDTTHHVHRALKDKFPYMTLPDVGDVINIGGQNDKTGRRGNYSQDLQYAIGNYTLLQDIINQKYPNDNKQKKDLLTQLEKMRSEYNKEAHSHPTYILADNHIFALETEAKLHPYAETLLKKNEGKFTILSGGKISRQYKTQLGLNNNNCYENLPPEEKETTARQIVENRKIPQDMVAAFGDGGNDWSMFNYVKVGILINKDHEKIKKVQNQAKFFAGVMLKDLGLFEKLNNVSKKVTETNRHLGYTSLAWSFVTEGTMMMAHSFHGPMFHLMHHLATQFFFSLEAQYQASKRTSDDPDKHQGRADFYKDIIIQQGNDLHKDLKQQFVDLPKNMRALTEDTVRQVKATPEEMKLYVHELKERTKSLPAGLQKFRNSLGKNFENFLRSLA